MQYLDPATPRRLDGWHSPTTSIDMPIVQYGHAGAPLLLFPTAAADYLENERFFLVKAIEPFILAGQVRVFSIDSINRYAWMDPKVPVPEQARRQALYASYVEDEVVPYIRRACGDDTVRIVTTGASFGAFHAANSLFRRPDQFRGVIAMSGFYDLAPSYFKGYSDDHCYFNNPCWYLRDLVGEPLRRLQADCRIVVASGRGAYEAPAESEKLAALLRDKGIPHQLDLWGVDVNHDWPWWRRMLPHHLPAFL
ncbi:MAG: alpha/beta hydrolase-fold protein [Vicinamibacterales bacterium]